MVWVKSLHIIFVVTWFAGLFYLPRLFVYHAVLLDPAGPADRAGSERFKVMERKLYFGIMTPGAILAIAFGLWLWLAWFRDAGAWMHAKLALVAILVGYHLWCGKLLDDFRRDRNRHSHVWYRWFNEFPVLILVGAVILVVVKPF
jgi:putative membrane protein